jgi:hypothetical protein
MSTGAILTVLSNIPWGQVMENAPKVADGAAKLWGKVTGSQKSAASAQGLGGSASTNAPTETEALRSQLMALETSMKDLEEQMRASSELIKALADQNTQLVQRIELNRVRLRRLSWVAAASGLLLLAAVGNLMLRQ